MSLTVDNIARAQTALLNGYREKFTGKHVDVQDSPTDEFHAFRGFCEDVRLDSDNSVYCVVRDADDNAFCPDVSLVTVLDN